MQKTLYIGHSIFLSPMQIHSAMNGEEIIADGACVPVVQNPDGSTTEPAGEMITKYSVKSGQESTIVGSNRGFSVFLQRVEDLTSPPTGCEWINFYCINNFETGKIIHQVVVAPDSILKWSTII